VRSVIGTLHHDVLLATVRPDLRARSAIGTLRHDVLSATVRPDHRARSVIGTPHHDVLSATVRPDHRVGLVTAGGLKIHSVASMMRAVPGTRLAQRPLGNAGGGLDRHEIRGVGQRVARPDRLRGDRRRFAAVEIPRPGRPNMVPEQQPALGTARSIQR
jgi:hypothetical protein